MPRRGDNIILTGFMGSGKSTVGRALARRLGWRFLDLDRAIARRAGRSVAAIFRARGEAAFRRMESRAIRSLKSLSRRVVATGGGAVVAPANRSALRAAGRVVYLNVPVRVLVRRLRKESGRPLLAEAGRNPGALGRMVTEMLKLRSRHYMKADVVMPVGAGVRPALAAVRIARGLGRIRGRRARGRSRGV
jgi:shikimate kinase